MKRAVLVVCFITMFGLPAAVLSASAGYDSKSAATQPKADKDKNKDKGEKDKDVKDKSVPAPPMLILLGAAAVVAGASKYYVARSRA